MCWEGECPYNNPMCCVECEAFQMCPEACDMVQECRKEDE